LRALSQLMRSPDVGNSSYWRRRTQAAVSARRRPRSGRHASVGCARADAASASSSSSESSARAGGACAILNEEQRTTHTLRTYRLRIENHKPRVSAGFHISASTASTQRQKELGRRAQTAAAPSTAQGRVQPREAMRAWLAQRLCGEAQQQPQPLARCRPRLGEQLQHPVDFPARSFSSPSSSIIVDPGALRTGIGYELHARLQACIDCSM
jgi:hypothetical protein